MQDLMMLAKWRVPTAFALSMVSDEFEHLSADQIVNLRLRRITPEMVRLLRRPRGTQPAAGEGAAQVNTGVIVPPLSPLPPVEPAGD